jgi:hypothetical protein
MRTFGIIMLCVLTVIGGSIAWYKISYPTYIYRYRLSIAVDVDGQTKTASSVIEVVNVTQPKFGSAGPIATQAVGDAVFLDLGANRHVIAILGWGPNGGTDYAGLLVPTLFHVGGEANFPKWETLRGSRELTGKYIPTLVTFVDLNNPDSARVIEPDSVVNPDAFAKAFGPGVHFKRAWIEMTADPVTHGIEEKMPMLITHRETLQRTFTDVRKYTAQYHQFIGH